MSGGWSATRSGWMSSSSWLLIKSRSLMAMETRMIFKLRLELKYILNVDILYSRSDLLLYVVTIAVMEDDI